MSTQRLKVAILRSRNGERAANKDTYIGYGMGRE